MFVVDLSLIASNWVHANVEQWYIHTTTNYLLLSNNKEQSNNLNGLKGHYAKERKPISKGRTFMILFMEHF